MPSKISSRLVLVGGGHSHVQFLKHLARHPLAYAEVVLVSPDVETPYSGLLPARLAGWCKDEDMHFNLGALCRQAGATFLVDRAVRVEERSVVLSERPALEFDVLSLNIGATIELPPGALGHPHVIPLKPIAELLRRWRVGERCVVVGGGAAGFEVAVVLRLAGSAVTLCERGPEILVGHGRSVQAQATKRLHDLGIALETNFAVDRFEGQRVCSRDGRRLDFDLAYLATGAKAPDVLDGLPRDDAGFVIVDEHLKVNDRVFAAGDCIRFDPPLPKSGVYAVRAGPILTANLRRRLLGKPLLRFRPQKLTLALLTSGSRRALLSYRGLAVEGEWLWTMKQKIDRRFMRMYGPQSVSAEPNLFELNTCGGCGGKLESTALAEFLSRSKGAEVSDVGWHEGFAVSVDGFRTFDKDLFAFGRVATLHAANDLWASGVAPTGATVHAQLAPHKYRVNQLEHLMAGVQLELKRMEAELLNAHSAEGLESAVSVTMLGRGERRWRKRGLKPGQVLVLTKALGTGRLLQGLMVGGLTAGSQRALWQTLLTSHGPILDLVRKAEVATDISGFGLLGHLREMLNGCAVEVGSVAVLPGFREVGLTPYIWTSNREAILPLWVGDEAPLDALCDPQTNGPLLLGYADKSQADQVVAELKARGFSEARVVGRVVEGPERLILKQT